MKFEYIFTLSLVLFSYQNIFAQAQFRVQETGCVVGDCDSGYGTFVYKDGTKYKGEFKNGMAEGTGTCFYANGDYYFGEWSKHTYHGEGMLQFKNGEKYEGSWVNGEFVRGDKLNHGTKEQSSGKVWALVIGISNYENNDRLKFADDDAYQFSSFLRSPEGGAVPEEQINLLIDEEASYKKILKAFDQLAEKADSNDMIWVYFSGHGIKGAFLPANYNEMVSNQLYHQEILSKVARCKAKNKVVIADICNAGTMLLDQQAMATKGRKKDAIKKHFKILNQEQDNTALILSSSKEEVSIENQGVRQGVFSYFMIEGLKGRADADKNKSVTIEEMFTYTQEQVKDYTDFQQNPLITGDFNKHLPLSILRD